MYKTLLLEDKCFSAPIPELVKYPRWQATRVKLKGIWSKEPAKGLGILKVFLGPVSKANCRDLRAVLNYLAALRGVKYPPIKSYRIIVKREVDKRRSQANN
jgi:hypothetical protein